LLPFRQNVPLENLTRAGQLRKDAYVNYQQVQENIAEAMTLMGYTTNPQLVTDARDLSLNDPIDLVMAQIQRSERIPIRRLPHIFWNQTTEVLNTRTWTKVVQLIQSIGSDNHPVWATRGYKQIGRAVYPASATSAELACLLNESSSGHLVSVKVGAVDPDRFFCSPLNFPPVSSSSLCNSQPNY